MITMSNNMQNPRKAFPNKTQNLMQNLKISSIPCHIRSNKTIKIFHQHYIPKTRNIFFKNILWWTPRENECHQQDQHQDWGNKNITWSNNEWKTWWIKNLNQSCWQKKSPTLTWNYQVLLKTNRIIPMNILMLISSNGHFSSRLKNIHMHLSSVTL